MKKKWILAIDQGTTGTTALLFDLQLRLVSRGYCAVTSVYPGPGRVEQDGMELLASVRSATADALRLGGAAPGEVLCVGLDNQGETCLAWRRDTGRPISPAIVWQDRRTAAQCEALRANARIREVTNLVPDAYFSASKLGWIFANVEGARAGAQAGNILAGTTDAWLIWKLTGGAVHKTEFSTASRTMLLNLKQRAWDPELCALFGVPVAALPEICDSACVFGMTQPDMLCGICAPITGAAVDQQAALFGQGCLAPGGIKTTYGTGCFMLMNTGASPAHACEGLVSTVAWGLDGALTYALDAGIYIAGAALKWMRDKLGILSDYAQSEALAREAGSTGGVVFVPAFVGLAAPHWDSSARGLIIGITGATERGHIARAAFEGIACQVCENLAVMRRAYGAEVECMRVDGGMVQNAFFMQLQADLLGIPVEVPAVSETTALGAAALAALGAGLFTRAEEAAGTPAIACRYEPRMSADERESALFRWRQAVERSRGWETCARG